MPDSTASHNQLPKFVGKYKIVRMIARSNDTVYEAIDPHLGRRVALKELTLASDISGAAKRERIERFQREAKAAGALKHPNVVTIYEVSQHLDHRFIAMEYLEGQTLRQMLQVGGPVAINEALKIALQLVDALGYAHTQGVVHRDVKPDNIHLIAPGNTVKLTDFGIARVLSEPSITSVGQVFGTPAYMSPEQLTSRQVDHRSDIFSAAAVIYEMIVGKKLFQGDSIAVITYKIMQSDPEMPSTIPTGIANVLKRALVKDPDQRYQNMRSLAADLRHELAFYDSAHHAPTPATRERGDDLDRIVVVSADTNAPIRMISANTQAHSQTTRQASSEQSDSDYVSTHHTSSAAATASILTAIDSDSQARDAAYRIVAMVVILLALMIGAGFSIDASIEKSSALSHHRHALVDYTRAVSEELSGNYQAAITDYTNARNELQGYSDDISDLSLQGASDSYVAEASASESSGDGSTAQQSLGQALALEPNSPVAHYDMGVVHKANGDLMDALHEFSVAYQNDPTGTIGLMAKGEAQEGYLDQANQDYQSGNVPRARQNFQKVIDLDPGDDAGKKAAEAITQLPT